MHEHHLGYITKLKSRKKKKKKTGWKGKKEVVHQFQRRGFGN